MPNRKNNKVLYYIINSIRYLTPDIFPRIMRSSILYKYNTLPVSKQREITERVNYYNKLSGIVNYPEKSADGSEMISLDRLKLKTIISGKKAKSVYIFDSYNYMRYFRKSLKAGFLFGDITHVPEIPSFVKSRPIHGENSHSVLLPLNKIRHFTTVKDKWRFTDKRDMLVGRAHVAQPQRIKFWEMYFSNPMCDLGNINPKLEGHPEWSVKPMSIDSHLKYKFILCIEGNDVATNLKWVMSSNSLAVMPKPTYETWHMEGKLIPGFHYVEIRPDYSDLEEQLKYYINHPDEAERISKNANEYIKRFANKTIEKITGLMVIDKYFQCTGQENCDKSKIMDK
ncbi:MAG: lipopolysaccharide A protein [Bacteroidales bacterium]|nr:lipopolysaccharide A protein [Bacteroidales bacterium]